MTEHDIFSSSGIERRFAEKPAKPFVTGLSVELNVAISITLRSVLVAGGGVAAPLPCALIGRFAEFYRIVDGRVIRLCDIYAYTPQSSAMYLGLTFREIELIPVLPELILHCRGIDRMGMRNHAFCNQAISHIFDVQKQKPQSSTMGNHGPLAKAKEQHRARKKYALPYQSGGVTAPPPIRLQIGEPRSNVKSVSDGPTGGLSARARGARGRAPLTPQAESSRTEDGQG